MYSSCLWVVYEGAPEEVTYGLGGQLRVPLVYCQLPTSATAQAQNYHNVC
jgi:hypothetical protein